MNEDIKKEWVSRLRSGLYEQGTSYLRTLSNKHCCLGILCEMAVEEGIVTRELIPSAVSSPARYNYVSKEGTYDHADINRLSPKTASDNVLPVGVMKWAGVDDITPSVHYEQGWLSLVNLNDSGIPFSDIAEKIEKGRI